MKKIPIFNKININYSNTEIETILNLKKLRKFEEWYSPICKILKLTCLTLHSNWKENYAKEYIRREAPLLITLGKACASRRVATQYHFH